MIGFVCMSNLKVLGFPVSKRKIMFAFLFRGENLH